MRDAVESGEGRPAAMDWETCHRIQQFLFLEARPMDGCRYDEWLALWDHDAHYWIPCNADDVDRSRHISLVNENRAGLEDRISRLRSPANVAQQPPSRTCHVIGNVELEPLDRPGEIAVHSTLSLTASRRGRMDVIAGRVRHHLRESDGGMKIVSKKVVLVNNDEVFGNLSFLV